MMFLSRSLIGLSLALLPGIALAQAQPLAQQPQVRAPSVTVTRVASREVLREVLVAGTLVPRDEVLVSAEVDGLSIVELLAEEGQRVEKGQVLARLSRVTLEVQLAQNSASLSRSEAAIAQARASIVEAEANVQQTSASLQRSETLQRSGYTSQEAYDQRIAAARTAEARLNSARDSLKAAMADKAANEATRRDIEIRLGRTEIKAPAAGVISRRAARLGAVAGMAGDPLFRLIEDGAVELEAEVAEAELPIVKVGQVVLVTPAGETAPVQGRVRLVSPEIDRATRLGKVRIALPPQARVTIGGFARGRIEAARRQAVAVPLSAVTYTRRGPVVQAVVDGKVATKPIRLGLVGDGLAEIVEGVAEGETVVAKAGVFVRDGDVVNPVMPAAEVKS